MIVSGGEPMNRIAVDVLVTWTKEGEIIPMALFWPMDQNGSYEKYEITKFDAPSGNRFKDINSTIKYFDVEIEGHKRTMYLQDGIWYIESNK